MQTYSIDNSQITASSQTSSEPEKYGTQSARIDDNYAWRAKAGATKGEYLQVDLGEIMTVTAVATQGDNGGSSWITTFTVKYSLNNETWKDFQVGWLVAVAIAVVAAVVDVVVAVVVVFILSLFKIVLMNERFTL